MSAQRVLRRWTWANLSDLLTVRQVAVRLGVSRTTAYRLIKRGRLPAGLVGTAIAVHRDAVEAFAAARPVQRPVVRRGRIRDPATAA